MKPITLQLLISVLAISCNSQDIADKIVLISVDSLDRGGIAEELAVINSMDPTVVGVDVIFSGRQDYHNDDRLVKELYNSKSLVMATVIQHFSGHERTYDWYAPGSEPIFLANATTGFVNTIIEDDSVGTLKRFSKAEWVQGKVEYHFAVQVAMNYDAARTNDFIANTPRIVDVKYDSRYRFKKFTAKDVLTDKLRAEEIEGKIVLIGILGPGLEDKFFTTRDNNEGTSGEPDMYGVEYLASIVAQILER